MPDPIRQLDAMLRSDDMLALTHLNHGIRITQPDGTGSSSSAPVNINFAFKVAASDQLKFTIQPGDVEIEPDTVIAWDSITGKTTEVEIEGEAGTSPTTWYYLWCNIVPEDYVLSAGTGETIPRGATLKHGTSITALTAEERKYTIQRQIAKLRVESGVIVSWKNLQCGNIDTSGGGDKFVKVSSGDSQTDYLENKVKADEDSSVTVEVVTGEDGYQYLEIGGGGDTGNPTPGEHFDHPVKLLWDGNETEPAESKSDAGTYWCVSSFGYETIGEVCYLVIRMTRKAFRFPSIKLLWNQQESRDDNAAGPGTVWRIDEEYSGFKDIGNGMQLVINMIPYSVFPNLGEQYQVLSVKSSTEIHWDWVRAH